MVTENQTGQEESGSWGVTLLRLVDVGFRTHDKMALEVVYNNISKRFSPKIAIDFLFQEYLRSIRNQEDSS